MRSRQVEKYMLLSKWPICMVLPVPPLEFTASNSLLCPVLHSQDSFEKIPRQYEALAEENAGARCGMSVIVTRQVLCCWEVKVDERGKGGLDFYLLCSDYLLLRLKQQGQTFKSGRCQRRKSVRSRLWRIVFLVTWGWYRDVYLHLFHLPTWLIISLD